MISFRDYLEEAKIIPFGNIWTNNYRKQLEELTQMQLKRELELVMKDPPGHIRDMKLAIIRQVRKQYES